MRVISIVAAAAAVAACSSSEAGLPLQPAGPPVARLLLPRFAAPGAAIPLDGSPSWSPGGALQHWRFEPGDGTPAIDSGNATAAHAFAAEGVFQISLEVEDLSGRTARAQGQLTVRTAPPACAADTDCGTGFDTCVRGRCTALWGPPCSPQPDGGPCQGCATD